MGRFPKPGLCANCKRTDNKRRNAKRSAHGRTSAAWRRFRNANLGNQCERCGTSEQGLTYHYKPAAFTRSTQTTTRPFADRVTDKSTHPEPMQTAERTPVSLGALPGLPRQGFRETNSTFAGETREYSV
jgi:hypothetical protein